MANRYKGEVTIDLDRARTLRLDYNAFAEFEGVIGRPWNYYVQLIASAQSLPPDEQVNATLELLGVRVLRALLWAGLVHEDPKLTVRQAGDLMQLAPGEIPILKEAYILTKVFEAYAAGLPDAAKKNVVDGMEKLRTELGTISTDFESSHGNMVSPMKSSGE